MTTVSTGRRCESCWGSADHSHGTALDESAEWYILATRFGEQSLVRDAREYWLPVAYDGHANGLTVMVMWWLSGCGECCDWL